LTAWSAAGVLGPVLVTYIRDYQLDQGIAKAQVYSVTMFILAGLLAAGFVCNWLVQPVDPKHSMTAEQLAATAPKQPAAGTSATAAQAQEKAPTVPEGGAALQVVGSGSQALPSIGVSMMSSTAPKPVRVDLARRSSTFNTKSSSERPVTSYWALNWKLGVSNTSGRLVSTSRVQRFPSGTSGNVNFTMS
jgi:hypothetical protein